MITRRKVGGHHDKAEGTSGCWGGLLDRRARDKAFGSTSGSGFHWLRTLGQLRRLRVALTASLLTLRSGSLESNGTSPDATRQTRGRRNVVRAALADPQVR